MWMRIKQPSIDRGLCLLEVHILLDEDMPWAFVPIFLVLAAIFLVYPNIGFTDFVGLILLLPVFGALAATPKFKTAVLLHRGV